MWEAIKITDEKFLSNLAEMAAGYYGEENDISKEDYLRHEYFHNPAGKVVMYAAYDKGNDAFVGQIAAVPVIIKSGRGLYRSLLAVNLITKDSYRGQGVFRELATNVFDREAKENYEFAYAMPNQFSYPGFLKYHGFRDLGRVPLYVRPIVPSGLVRSYLHSRKLSRIAGLFDGAFRINNSFSENKESRSRFALEDFKTGAIKYADSFWESIKDDYQVMVCRDYDYLKWKYLDVPYRDYKGYYALHDGNAVAFVIGRNMKVSGINCAMIADFLFIKGYEQIASEVVKKLLRELTDSGAEMAGCMVPPNSKERRILTRIKFFKCPLLLEPQPFRFIFRQINNSDDTSPKSAELKNWFFTLGDYDVV